MDAQCRHEIWRLRIMILVATLVGLTLRIWPIGRLGFNQFDEGIYGMAAGWVANSASIASIDPSLIPYAPPGYPILVGIASWLIGSSDQTSLLVSASLGSLTIPVVFCLSSRILGARAGLISAWSVCFSGPHIAFSRMGLTDASFLFVWSLGFLVGLRFLQTPGIISGITMGTLVGLTQQFKYNGWLLGALIITTVAVGLVSNRNCRNRHYLGRVALWGGLAVITAWSIVEPWYRFVETHGGYAKLLNHQRSYLGGLQSWWPHLRAQADQAAALSGPSWLAVVNIIVVVLAVRFASSPTLPLNELPQDATKWGPLLKLALLFPILAAPATSGLIFLTTLPAIRETGKRLLVTSWLVLFGLTPFYHPYARLWLPFEMLHWIIIGGIGSELFELKSRLNLSLRWTWKRPWIVGLAGLVVGAVLIFWSRIPICHAKQLESRPSVRAE